MPGTKETQQTDRGAHGHLRQQVTDLLDKGRMERPSPAPRRSSRWPKMISLSKQKDMAAYRQAPELHHPRGRGAQGL